MKSALLLIDIQNDYFPGGASVLHNPDAACENAVRLLNRFRESGQPVMHVQHLAVRPDATFFVPGTEGAKIHFLIQPKPDELVIEKNFPNCFRNTTLLQQLHDAGITHLVVCGMMTHMCVDATVRAAKDFGFHCTVIADACATKDITVLGHTVHAEQVQNSFLAALGYFYADIRQTEAFLKDVAHL